MAAAFSEIGKRARHGGTTEFEIQQWIVEAFQRENLVMDSPAIVAANQKQRHSTLRALGKGLGPNRRRRLRFAGCLGKKEYAWRDILRHQLDRFCRKLTADHIRKIFEIVKASRDAGIQKVCSAISAGEKLCGWEVDKASRDVIEAAGYGKYLNNRVGHSIGTEVHGMARTWTITNPAMIAK